MGKNKCYGRRNFLKATAAGIAGIAITSRVGKVFAATSRTAAGTAPLNKWPGRVVINFNKACPNGNVQPTTTQVALIKTMIDDSIKLLTKQTDVGAAWKSIFPSSGANAISLTSKIAIKVPIGCSSTLSVPHWFSVKPITDGLQLMDFGGTKFPAANITFYDGACANNFNACGFTATNFPGIGGFVFGSRGSGYTDGAPDNTGTKQMYATTLHDADFLINVFSPRGHADHAEKVTLGFKNHYGTYPTLYHAAPDTSQYLRNISCTGVVYNKNILSVCSALYAQYEGNGPTGSPQDYSIYSKFMDATSTNVCPTTIIMGTDPISVEMQAMKIMRIQGNGQYTTAAMPNYLKASGGVVITGTNWPPDPSLPNAMDNIGIIDESKMTVLRIINGTLPTPVIEGQSALGAGQGEFVHASPISSHSTFIEFALPESHAGKEAAIEIYDIKGRQVTRFSQKVLGVLNHMSWNENNASGSHVGPGTYVVRLISGSVNVSSRFSIV
jgi:hypothetical protein